MSHARQQIRAKFVALVTGLTTTGANVFPSRSFTLDEDSLPSLSVYTNDETIDKVAHTVNGALMQRGLEVVIEAHAKDSDGLADLLDTIAAEVETVLAAPILMGSVEITAGLQSTQTVFLSDGETDIGALRLVYLVTFGTFERDPQTIV
jgi:hypothetical protein